ncbi:MAG: hypothetical protein KTR14_09315, partial [Vampirovibrio sp.]|nr:hypothetical protein [Vampirovibrio sp.]
MVGHIDGGKPRQKFVDFRNPATGFVEKIAVQEPVTTVFSNTDSDTLDIAGIFGIGRQVVTSGQEVLVAQNHLGGNRDDGSPPTSVVDVTRLLDALKHDFDFHIQGFTALEDHQQGDYGSGVVQFAIDMQGTIDRIKALLDDTAPMTAERQTELNTLLNELNIRRTVALEKKAQFQETVEPRLEEIQTQINELRKTDSKAADDAQKRFDIEKADIEKHSIYELIENVGSLEQEYRAALEQRVKTQDGAALTIDQATGQNTTQALKTKADELAQSVKDFYLSQLETSYQVSASGIELELSPSDEALAKAEETLEAGQDFIDKNASYADEREQLRQQLRQLDTQYDQLTDTAEYKAYGNEGLDKVGSTLDGTADLFAALPSNLEDLKHNVEVLARKVADAKASADKAVDNTPILDISKFEEFKKEITGLIGNNPTAKQLVEASDLIAARWQAIAPEQGGTEKANKFYIQELNKLDEEISSKVALSAINLITDKAREYSIEGTMVEPTDKKGWIRQRTETTSDVNYPDITITHPDMKEGKRLEDEDA